MIVKGCEQLATAYLPQTYRLVKTATGKKLPIGAEDHRSHPMGMARQGLEQLATAYLPQTYRLIIASTGQDPTIWVKAYRADPVHMPTKSPHYHTPDPKTPSYHPHHPSYP